MRKAVTIIEVLTVIMIILIVAAVAFPVFTQSKARAKDVVCLSNLKQILVGVELYKADYDVLPYTSNDVPGWIEGYSGGVRLRCPKNASESAADYFIFAGYPADVETNSSSASWAEKLAQCREIRGSEYVIAYDYHHRGAAEGQQAGGPRVLLLREGGAAVSVPYRNSLGSWLPCNRDLPLEIQH
jgi:type II secretory pathway pseudopilin PulG